MKMAFTAVVKASPFKVKGMARIASHHPIPSCFAISLFFFMGVEYTLKMVPSSSPPKDIGFLLTENIHGFLSTRPVFNSLLAALNTVFVGMQAVYVGWVFLVEERPRATIAALFMFTCRGVMGYCTQLPLPHEFLSSGVDFPVGNVSFFLFFSGHIAGAMIASLDMRRMKRRRLALVFDYLNALQAFRLLATRGHYTIDLAVGLAAGFFFDILAGKYAAWKSNIMPSGFYQGADCSCCNGNCR
ncbi:phosphatidylcholine:diacylglycerol cholinephosphotransferase 1-like [Dendrobium catenatum]|nr:phosphatidylcholine:diacylglycerol cholinephosphotransferase 1-like [Dendrobium catenatum]